MSGGRKDASTPDLLNGGEFLLSLLQRPHQHHPQASLQPRPAQPLTVDPAVAAVGPTVQFPVPRHPAGLDHFPLWPQNLSPPFPHSYPQNYVGFADDLRRFGSGFQGINSTGVAQQGEQSLRFGSFSLEIDPSERVPNGNSIESSSLDNVREVGSGSRNHSMLERNRQVNRQGNSIPNADVFRPANFDSREHGRGRGGWGNQNRNQGVNLQRSTPPGFPAKPRDGNNGGLSESRRGFEHNVGESRRGFEHNVGESRRGFEHNVGESRRGFEHNVGERSGNFRDSRHSGSNLGDERPRGSRVPVNDHALHGWDYEESDLLGKLGSPSPPQGSKLHSVPGSEIEESLSNLHLNNVKEENRAEGGRQQLRGGGGNVDAGELDEFHEHIMDALLEDESDDKNKKINHVSREKEYRSDSRGQRILNQRMRNLKRFMDCRSDINRLSAPFLRIYESLIPPDEEKAKQKQLLSLLENLVNKEWPEARLYLYGSCASSFGVCKSDIDVCLAFEDADVDKSEVLLKLAEILEADNLQNVQALTRARVPIVKLMDPVTGISCDICINNVLAVVNTKLLRDYAQIDERLRQLAYIVKHWAKSRGVNETYQGTLSSYAYVLMCIHFLQQRRPAILPCLQEMEATYNVTVDDIKCSFFDQVEKLRNFGSRNKESISQLVWAFFNYWAYRHDYTNTVISVRTGSLLSKQVKDWTRRVGNDRHLICIEDPFDTSHDLGRVVDKFSIRVLREEFERAAEIMQYDPNPCVTLFEPYISPSS